MVEGNQDKADVNEQTADELAVLKKRMAGAAVSKMVASAIGDMVTLYSKDPAHKHFAFADMEWKILPPIINGQFFITHADDEAFGTLRPIGMVTWAKVSDELDERLSKQVQGELVRLHPQEWTIGEHIWLVDVVGTKEGVRKALRILNENQFLDLEVKVPVRESSGNLAISTLAELLNDNFERKSS